MTQWIIAAEASNWTFGWEALVALGTLVLAVATFALAWLNRAIVTSSREELAETRKDVATAQDQAQIARRALAAQTQPLLSSVPRGIASPPQSTGDAGDISAEFDVDRGGHMSVPFRNVGNAVAVIKTVMFWMHDRARPATLRTPPCRRARSRGRASSCRRPRDSATR